jgi:saccharopine dehydrogenase-like NADP-dependent oxidoreductase
LATFGESFGCPEASFRLALTPALLGRLKELAHADPAIVAAAARDAVPASPETVSVHLVTAEGGDERVTVRAITRPSLGLGGAVMSTGAPAAAVVRLMARGAVDATGAHPPERCIEPDAMFAELETRGCSFTVARAPSGN